MLKEWQFNVLFFVGVGGAIVLLFGPDLGLDVSSNPTALAGVGSILGYVLTQKRTFTKHDDKNDSGSEENGKEGEDGDV